MSGRKIFYLLSKDDCLVLPPRDRLSYATSNGFVLCYAARASGRSRKQRQWVALEGRKRLSCEKGSLGGLDRGAANQGSLFVLMGSGR